MTGESQQEPEHLPDPSVLTTDQIMREVFHLRELMYARIDGLEARVDERYTTHIDATGKEFESIRETVSMGFANVDSAVQKAFEAAEKAVDRRQDQADKEFHEHLAQVRHENALAFLNADKAVQAALDAQKEAVHKAEAATEKRFESVNEFRAQLNDQANTFMPRQESLQLHERSAERIGELTDRINRSEGRTTGYAALYGWAIAGIGLIISVVIVANTLLAR